MIKASQILKEVQVNSCDNCNRVMPFVLQYIFYSSKSKEHNRITLCEDCANAVSNLFYKVMEKGKPFKYEKDEIKEVEEI